MPNSRIASVLEKATLLFAAIGALLASGTGARAEFKMHYPIVDYREFEFEHNGSVTFDKSGSGRNNGQSFTYEIGYGFLPFWEPEIEGEFETVPGQNQRFDATTFENTFQLTPQGEYWANIGFFAEYSMASSHNDPHSFTFGPLVQKQTNSFFGLNLGKSTLDTLNLLFTKQVGPNHSDATPLAISWQSRLLLNPLFQPGFEYYGQISSISGRSTPDQAVPVEHRIGPVLVGQYNFFQYGKIKYEVGYLFGLNNATEKGAVTWRFEYERPF